MVGEHRKGASLQLAKIEKTESEQSPLFAVTRHCYRRSRSFSGNFFTIPIILEVLSNAPVAYASLSWGSARADFGVFAVCSRA